LRLLEGLEASEILFSKMRDNARLDAGFAAHAKSDWLGQLQQKRVFVPLGSKMAFIGSGHTPYGHDVSIGEVGFVTVECVDALRFHPDKLKRITQTQYDSQFLTKRVKAGSVLCTIKRRICKAYPFLEEPTQPLALNQDVALLCPQSDL